jgi:hypothetical protein
MPSTLIYYWFSYPLVILLIISVRALIIHRNNKRAVQSFLRLVAPFNPLVLSSIPIQYCISIRGRGTTSVYNECNLYFFLDCLAIVRQQNLVFSFQFPPVIITADVVKARKTFDQFACYKPTRAKANTAFTGRFQIIVENQPAKDYRINIFLKSLTHDQIDCLTKVQEWC